MAEPLRLRMIREAYAAFNAGNVDVVLGLLDEHVEWHPPPSSPEPQPLHGREAARDYLLPDLFDEQSAEPLELIEEGNRVLVVVRVQARGRESGIEVDQTIFHVWHIEGERATRFEAHVDREHALAALRA